MTNWIIKLIAMVISSASPEIRLALCSFVKEFKVKAESTPNPWDDILAGMLGAILGCYESPEATVPAKKK